MDTYQINLNTGELEALQKTVGIALDNLSQKINKHGKTSKLGRQASSDRLTLLDIQAEIVAALTEAYNV